MPFLWVLLCLVFSSSLDDVCTVITLSSAYRCTLHSFRARRKSLMKMTNSRVLGWTRATCHIQHRTRITARLSPLSPSSPDTTEIYQTGQWSSPSWIVIIGLQKTLYTVRTNILGHGPNAQAFSSPRGSGKGGDNWYPHIYCPLWIAESKRWFSHLLGIYC